VELEERANVFVSINAQKVLLGQHGEPASPEADMLWMTMIPMRMCEEEMLDPSVIDPEVPHLHQSVGVEVNLDALIDVVGRP